MSNNESSAFQYPDLEEKQIRLVELHAASDDTLRCSLRTADPDAFPLYEALSYAWGDGAPTAAVDCDGATIRVTPNLYTALQFLREETKSRTLWVDQICIDQNNDLEKSRQIVKMPQIFGGAQRVLVWLGEDDSTTDLAFDSIRTVALRAATLFREDKLDYVSGGGLTQRTLSDLQLTPRSAPEWAAYRSILSRPWFTRVWTYEEVVLAKEARMLCGRRDISWAEFTVAYGILLAADDTLPGHESYHMGLQGIARFVHFGRVLRSERTDRKNYRATHDLLNLVRMLRTNSTKHARDRIYGALGVAMDLDDRTPKVDVSADYRKIYCDFTKWFIYRYSDLSVLKLVDISAKFDRERQDPKSLPSWTPNYHHYDHDNNLIVEMGRKLLAHGSERFYNATGSSQAQLVNEDIFRLTVQGIRVGKINDISMPSGNLTNGIVISSRVVTAGDWFQLAAKHFPDGVYKHTDEPLEFAYARTRIGDSLFGENSISHRHARVTAMKAQGYPANLLEPGEATMKDGLVYTSTEDITHVILKHTYRRRFYITDTGYMGICHRSCREGDEVYLLMGGEMPFILRRLESGDFAFKGESYVHGVMDGELLLGSEEQISTTQQRRDDSDVGNADSESPSSRMESITLV